MSIPLRRHASLTAHVPLALMSLHLAACVGISEPPVDDAPPPAGRDASAFRLVETGPVAPLIDSTWAQSGGLAPAFTYNNKTPLVGPDRDQRAPVGCIAVAFGQVLRYYGFPRIGTGATAYCNAGGPMPGCEDPVEADFYLTRYDWSAMPPSLNSLSAPESVDAVSTLLSHIGAAVNVKYGVDGSAAKLANPAIITSFRRHFGMPGIETVRRSDYSQEGWYELITGEIRRGRPVVFVGFNSALDAGHAYILDGIDAEGRVHVNWGWGGYLNDYYDLHSLTTRHGAFTEDLFALVNFTPYILEENEPCNGLRGLRCREGLLCVSDETDQPIVDYVNNEEAGTCRAEVPGADDGDAPAATERVVEERSGAVEPGQWVHLGSFSTLDGIEVSMTGDGDADLYVRQGSQPGDAPGEFDCRPYRSNSNERCEDTGAGVFFVSVRGYEASSFTVTVVTQQAAGPDDAS